MVKERGVGVGNEKVSLWRKTTMGMVYEKVKVQEEESNGCGVRMVKKRWGGKCGDSGW